MKILHEFKEFAAKGNALDMAVGIILGAAFNKVVSSIVDDLIMPPVGLLIGGVDFKNLVIVLKHATDPAAVVAIRLGLFLNSVIQFLIVAFSVFIIVKVMHKIILARQPAPILPSS